MEYTRRCCCKFGKEFKVFALRGNMLDLAVGIIIGTAFQNVVKSLVDDIITPPFGLIFDGVDFSNLTIKMRNFVHKEQPPVVIRYGIFIQQVIHLLIIALALFGIVKVINKLHKIAAHNRQSTTVSEPSEEVKVLREIRDLIAGNKNGTTLPSSVSSLIEPTPSLISI